MLSIYFSIGRKLVLQSALMLLLLPGFVTPASAQLFGKKKTADEQPPAPRLEVESLAELFPAGALAFGETEALGELLSYVRGESLLDLFLKSEEFGHMQRDKGFLEVDATRKLLEFVLRMSLWEAGAKLLGGEFGLALYPRAQGEDPDIVAILRPGEGSAWLKTRVLLAPLARIGLKRVERFIGNDVVIFRTRGDKEDATYITFHDRWIAIGSDLDLLKKTIGLQSPPAPESVQVPLLSAEPAYRTMTGKMGMNHLARVFVNTRLIPEATGENLGVKGEDLKDPLLQLYVGGTMELLGKSRFAGITLNKKDNVIEVRSTIDARPEDLDERHRILFTGGKGRVERLPEWAGMLGGFSMQRQVSDWYGKRGETIIKSAEVPGFEKFEGVLEKLMVRGEKPLLGDRFLFVTAHVEDGGVSGFTGAQLPGFGIQADLADPSNADAAMDELFPLMLNEISQATDRNWNRDEKKEGDGDNEVETKERVPVISDWVIAEKEIDGMKYRAAESVTHPGMNPAAICMGDVMILSSSCALCQQLVGHQRDERQWENDKDFVFSIRFNEMAKFLAANEGAFKATMVREGDSQRTADEAMHGLKVLLSRVNVISGSTTAVNGFLELLVRGELK